MPDFFVWCAHCGDPHDLGVEVCPTTGKPVTGDYPRGSTRPFVGTKVGGYLLRSPIGEGGVGAVFEAERCSDGQTFAVKVIKPGKGPGISSAWRLHREARLASSIVHPNVCRVFEVSLLDDGAPYLVMERLLGETLRTRLKREGALDLPDAVGIFTQVLAGLAAAHDLGIVHRDVTPQNIFLLASPQHPSPVKLLDFGLSKRIEEDAYGRDLGTMVTTTGIALGTLEYMPPEQARAESVDARVDLYACGVSLYEALTGTRPFRGVKIADIAYAPGGITFPMPSEVRADLPPLVDLVITRAMAADRSERFADAREFILALAPLLDTRTETATLQRTPLAAEEELEVVWSEEGVELTTSERITEDSRTALEEVTEEERTVPRLRRL